MLTLTLRVPSVSIESHSSPARCLGGLCVWLLIVFPLPESHACGSVCGDSLLERPMNLARALPATESDKRMEH